MTMIHSFLSVSKLGTFQGVISQMLWTRLVVLMCGKVWQLAALPILKRGCCWRVGNGVSIRVHKDKWIPNYPANKILYPTQEESEEWLVSQLIDSISHYWRCDVIMSSFHREDAKAICKIHLSHRQVPYSMVWLHNRKGVYSIKSGYYIQQER